MIDLQKGTVDTVIAPDDGLAEELKLEDSDNMLNQNQFTGGDETQLLGDGVPGYETTGEDVPLYDQNDNPITPSSTPGC